MALHTESKVTFHSSDRGLVKGFERVKHQALHWVFEGYPVGDYYEAALPNRDAFCMRDVSHQCVGGEVLGLASHNKNMFLKFAQSISDVRDWCAHWEIDRWDRPCPVDHKNDQDFWYNLPANFDVLHACWRMYEWTGDRYYLTHPDFDYYYAQVMEAYIKRWDTNGDGIPDRAADKSRRGIAGYDESQFTWKTLQTATDTLSVMARAHISYAKMCRQLGRSEQEVIYRERGEEMLKRLNRDFYTEECGFAKGFDYEGKLFYRTNDYTSSGSLLYWDTVSDQSRRERMLDVYAAGMETTQIEGLSHYPEIQWRYGRNKEAMRSLRKLFDPNLHRKEYPEASFCTIGAVATGLMGIQPNAADNKIGTISGLDDTDWAELCYIPMLGNEISIRHDGNTATEFTLNGGDQVIWRPAFHGGGLIEINGAACDTKKAVCEFTGKPYIYTDVPVKPGETCMAAKRA